MSFVLPVCVERLIVFYLSGDEAEGVENVVSACEAGLISKGSARLAIINDADVYSVLQVVNVYPERVLDVIGQDGFSSIVEKQFKPISFEDLDYLIQTKRKYFKTELIDEIDCYKLLKRIIIRFPAFACFISKSVYQNRRFIVDRRFWRSHDEYVFDFITKKSRETD